MKTIILKCFFLLSSAVLFGQNWSTVGSPQFTNFADNADFTFDSTGAPYVLYKDVVSGWPTVKKFDGVNWVEIGTSGSWGNSNSTLYAIAIHPTTNMPWVAWKQGTYVNVYYYDGISWNHDGQITLYSPISAPLEFVFNSSNEAVIYHHKAGGGSSSHDYFRLFRQGSWAGSNMWTGLPITNLVTTDVNGESIFNEITLANNTSQVRALNATGGVKFTINTSVLNGKRFDKLSMIGNYWVGNDVISGTSGITFGLSTSINIPQPSGTSGNTGDYLKLVNRTQGNLLYLMFSDASNQLQIQRYKTASSQWSSLPSLAINTSASGYLVDIEVNNVDNALYVLYQDSGRLSMQKFTEVPALTRYYVNTNVVGGDGSGDSWVNAMPNLTDALASADSNTTEIWVAEGTYNPGSSRSDTFGIGIDNIAIYGGFNGTETALSERNPLTNVTILSGDLNGDDTGVGFVNTSRYDNSYHVVDLDANNVIVDGFQINDGHANGSGTNAYGGAILVRSTSENFILRNCEINQNIGLTGGAIRSYLDVSTGMTFENCRFFNNISRYGGGLYFLVNANRTVTLDITNCLFEQNITVDQSSSARGYTGSAAWIRANASGSNLTSTITNCTFANNLDRGTQSGSTRGPLGLSRRTDGTSNHTVTINNSIFYYNDQGVSGATALMVNNGHTSYPNTTFVNNSISEDDFSNLIFLTNTSNSDPLFVDATNGDFMLQSGSPAIDFGDNSFVPAGVTLDLNGNDRIINGIVDLGSFEFDATLSIPSLSINETVLSPNPAQDAIAIFGLKNTVSLQIFDILGNVVLRKSVYQSGSIDISNLRSGLYVVLINDGNGAIAKRFIRK